MSSAVQIVSMGQYLPRKVVSSASLEERLDLEPGWIEDHQGVAERRWAEGEETHSFMGAQAALEALGNAGLGEGDIDLIISASGSCEQGIPDTAALIERALGWGMSGIPCFHVHATCLSFLVALDVAVSFIKSGRHQTILIVTSEVTGGSLDWSHPESSTLFGDGAVAAIVRPTPVGENSAIEQLHFETYGDGAHLTEVLGGGMRVHPNDPNTRPEDFLFRMDSRGVMRMVGKLAIPFFERVRTGLSKGLGDIDLVVPHQASKLGIRSLQFFGMTADKVVHTLESRGNCIAASIPITLHHAIETGRLKRGDRVLLVGSGAGLSLGAVILTY